MSENLGLQLLNEGKTKKVWLKGPGVVLLESKDDLTAGDGQKHDVVTGKAELANRTTCNVFRLLKRNNIPLAFIEQFDNISFLAQECEMVLYEVVVRREAHGSFLKRNPEYTKGYVFQDLVVEFFLKTSGRKWGDIDIPKDDPLVIFKNGKAELYLPDQPINQQEPFMVLNDFPFSDDPSSLLEMKEIAGETFFILEKAWQSVGKKLVDFKVEFGTTCDGELLLADVIDNDSWRVVEDGNYIDKQVYRDGGDINLVTQKYRQVAELTNSFCE